MECTLLLLEERCDDEREDLASTRVRVYGGGWHARGGGRQSSERGRRQAAAGLQLRESSVMYGRVIPLQRKLRFKRLCVYDASVPNL